MISLIAELNLHTLFQVAYVFPIFFIYILITKVDAIKPVARGLILLSTLPLLLIAKKEKFAEIVANGAYYLLVVGVTAQLINLSMENGKNKRSSF